MPIINTMTNLKMGRASGPRTKLVSWRGGELEFCRAAGLALNSTKPAKPPWYVIRYRGIFWGRDEWHYDWLDYGGPPEVFLTRQRAEHRAKQFREQYGGGEQFGGGPLKVEVVKMSPEISHRQKIRKSNDQKP